MTIAALSPMTARPKRLRIAFRPRERKTFGVETKHGGRWLKTDELHSAVADGTAARRRVFSHLFHRDELADRHHLLAVETRDLRLMERVIIIGRDAEADARQ
jgi:hypothetical protein